MSIYVDWLRTAAKFLSDNPGKLPPSQTLGHRDLLQTAEHLERTETKLHTVEADRKLAMKRIDELEAKIKQEFDIATGYHSRWQRAEKELEQAQLRLEQGRALLDALANQQLIDEMPPDLREGDFEAGYETFVTKCRELRGLLFPAAVEGQVPADYPSGDPFNEGRAPIADLCKTPECRNEIIRPPGRKPIDYCGDCEARAAERQGPSKCWWPDCPCHQQSDCPFREAADVERTGPTE